MNRTWRKRLGLFKGLIKEIEEFRKEAEQMVKEKEKAYNAKGRKDENDLIEFLF